MTDQPDDWAAAGDLIDCLNDLTFTVRDWTLHPHSDVQRRAAREALDTADAAFAEYERALSAWAAGSAQPAETTQQLARRYGSAADAQDTNTEK